MSSAVWSAIRRLQGYDDDNDDDGDDDDDADIKNMEKKEESEKNPQVCMLFSLTKKYSAYQSVFCERFSLIFRRLGLGQGGPGILSSRLNALCARQQGGSHSYTNPTCVPAGTYTGGTGTQQGSGGTGTHHGSGGTGSGTVTHRPPATQAPVVDPNQPIEELPGK